MKLSCSASLGPDLLLPGVVEMAREAGFGAVELFRDRTESTPVHPDWSVPMVRDHLQGAGMALSGFNIRDLTGRKADSDERNLDYNLRQLEWDIHLGRALGLHQFNLKGGSRTREALEDLVEGVNTLLERIPAIEINLGSRPGSCVEGLEDYQEILPQLNQRARILLDCGDLLAAGQDVLAVAAGFAERIGLVHLADCKEGQAVPLGEGDLPLGPLVKQLEEAAYQGFWVVEYQGNPLVDPVERATAARRRLEEQS